LTLRPSSVERPHRSGVVLGQHYKQDEPHMTRTFNDHSFLSDDRITNDIIAAFGNDLSLDDDCIDLDETVYA
jgi:hypothetical protein